MSDKYNLLSNEYNTLLQLNVDYIKSQLLLKSILVTLVAGGTAILLNNESEYIFCVKFIALDILSGIITIFLLFVTVLLSFLHREFEHYKIINVGLISKIERQYLESSSIDFDWFTDDMKTKPFQMQAMSYQIDSEIKKGKNFLRKINLLGYAFYWAMACFIFIAYIIDMTLYNLYL